MPHLLPPEDANHSMNAVYVFFNREHVCRWRKRETETKAEKTANALHVLSAARDGGDVRQKSVSRYGCTRRYCAVDKSNRSESKGR